MTKSPLVSIRIPPETLERIDLLAQKLYPSRRAGRNPNRSQVILDAIEQFLVQHEMQLHSSDDRAPDIIDERINTALQRYQRNLERQIKDYIDNKFLAYTYNLKRQLIAAKKQ
ncbi:CopG family transcriptional regulator [Hydrococcus rivularis NIES-593]|uniref:CopG family transcriptional regulator n=1 Tax=Hydrococcus rivularis NIES-593 TaxID=1921803 RepID=A0A1U7HNQ0_9CYAN|nr:ribbon-helix-helix domain-containing protein [Hydrococcus rivularis]OKH25223.1 CopG family transcriptional regulator [Hydrococcus rivularis NIES-593]